MCDHNGGNCPKKCQCVCDGCCAYAAKENKSRQGRRARAKGKKAQKDVAADLRAALGLTEDELFSAVGGKTEDDIRGSEAFRKRFPFHPEIKNEKTVRAPAWIAQVEADEKKLKRKFPWVIIFKQHNKKQFYCLLKMEELLKWLPKN